MAETPTEQPTSEDPEARSAAGAGSVLRFPTRRREAPPAPVSDGLRTALGEVLREERQRQDRTLADVAGDAAVSVAYLSEIERARKDVSSDLLDAVCDALDVPLATVLERCADRLRAGTQRGVQFTALAA